jgi:hypothetical protein
MRFLLFVALIIPLGPVAGCGGPAGVPVTAENRAEIALSDVGELYRQYPFSNHKPPKKISDFAPLDSMAPLGLKALRDGDVVARSGVVIEDVNEGPATRDSADEVIAYAKDAPTAGGDVLMHNRTVRKMTAEEFKAAKLAGDGDMAAGPPAKGKKP